MTHSLGIGQHLIDDPITGFKGKIAKVVELEVVDAPKCVDSLTKADLATSSH